MSELRRQKAWRSQPLRKQKVAGKKLEKGVKKLIAISPEAQYRRELARLQFNAAGRRGGLYDRY
jgi:hypothetical protein